MKKVGVKALQNLSSLPENGLQMIREGAVDQLFKLLYCHRLSSTSLREQVASTIMHLAISTTTPEADQMKALIFKSEEDIFRLFSLISLTGPHVQQSILQTFIAVCQSSSGFEIRTTLRQVYYWNSCKFLFFCLHAWFCVSALKSFCAYNFFVCSSNTGI